MSAERKIGKNFCTEDGRCTPEMHFSQAYCDMAEMVPGVQLNVGFACTYGQSTNQFVHTKQIGNEVVKFGRVTLCAYPNKKSVYNDPI